MQETYVTKGGIQVIRTKDPVAIETALAEVYKNIDQAKGCILASDYEYPGRYSRWDIGFVDPPIELVSKGREFTVRALNERGKAILTMLKPAIVSCEHTEKVAASDKEIAGKILPMPSGFPEELRSKQPSIFSILRALYDLLECDDEYLTMFGAFGYDLVFQFEPIEFKHDRGEVGPDCHLFLADRIGAIDHQRKEAFKLSYEFTGPDGVGTEGIPVTGQRKPMNRTITSTDVDCDHAPGEYAEKVEKIRQGCHAGDFFEVVLSQEFKIKCGYFPTELFERVRMSNPSPYDFLINLGDEQLIGASPEMFVKVKEGEVETCPISGTVQRGESPMEDAEQIRILLASKKDEAELTMCTDVDRNDKSRVCVPGSVQLVGRRLIESYSRLFHTVDHVKGRLQQGYDMFDAFLTHMWACTLTGAPKPIAMQTIENLENSARRWYGGCVGLFTFNGQLNTGITIRTIHLENSVAAVRAGATLLYESRPDDEEKETRIKAAAFINAVTTKEYEKPPMFNPSMIKSKAGKRVLFVDNQDSFVHTLANYVRQTGVEVVTLRKGFPEEKFDELKPDLVFISPGPETPSRMGVPELVGKAVQRKLPVFGVCLGHQGIAEYFGATLGVMPEPMHGKESVIRHSGSDIFRNVPNSFPGGRYHSIFVHKEGLPGCLEITAESDDGYIMALRHKDLPIACIQFHPESILTLQDNIGLKIISNVLDLLI